MSDELGWRRAAERLSAENAAMRGAIAAVREACYQARDEPAFVLAGKIRRTIGAAMADTVEHYGFDPAESVGFPQTEKSSE